MTANSAPAQVVAAVARLLDVPAGSVMMTRLPQGLSHHNFDCCIDAARYFVKVYDLGDAAGPRVRQINRVTDTMREQGVPAPELVAYSRRYPNVVIHRYVDAPQVSWDPAYIQPVAALYSRIASFALRKPEWVARTAYTDDLRRVAASIASLADDSSTLNQPAAARALDLCQLAISKIENTLPAEQLLVLTLHDDFTENNILAEGGKIRLICDWDSYRPSPFIENLACSSVRFSSSAPLQGVLESARLQSFFLGLSDPVLQAATDHPACLEVFPFLAILRHLRTYPFRTQVVAKRRPELNETLLQAPVAHCEWLVNNAEGVTAQLNRILRQ